MSSRECLVKSTWIATVFHIALATVLFSNPLHLYPRIFSYAGKTPTVLIEEENVALLKKNQALEEAFSCFEVVPATQLKHPPRPLLTKGAHTALFEPSAQLRDVALSVVQFEHPALLNFLAPALSQEAPLFIEAAAFAKLQPILEAPRIELISSEELSDPSGTSESVPCALPFLPDTPSSLHFIPTEEPLEDIAGSSSVQIPPTVLLDQMYPSLGPPVRFELGDALLKEERVGSYSDFSIPPSSPKSIVEIKPGSWLSDYGLPSLPMREWQEFFDLDVKTFAKEEGGFIFSIQIIPKVDLSEYRMNQTYLFLIDRSSASEKHRYQTAKRAVSRAIAALRPGDLFNILVLDSSMAALSETALALTKENQQKAEEFLEKQSSISGETSGDVYSSLAKVLNLKPAEGETVTAILISDGNSTLPPNQQRKKINQWLEANRDRITLYTATAGHGNKLASLKMLSLASRGLLLYSDTHAAFPRKLAKLIMDLRYPIAKGMTVSIIPPPTGERMELLPPSSRLPNLFSDHPYTFVGTTPQLEDFTLVLEGKNKDQVFTIKKTVALSQAKQGSRLLLKRWSDEKAHTLFDQYLREGQITFLHQAEKQLGHDTQNSRR